MRYLSVCSGIEAATQAWHPLGWEPAAFSEIEKFPRAVLAHHYPDVPLHGDFTTIKGDEYGSIDLLCGGTPCQSFSVAGLRGGMGDDRGNLSLEFLKLAKRTGARWIVWENVPGVLSSNGGRDFGAIIGGLAELGYGFAYRVLDAQYMRTQRFPYAVPQRRRRVVLVGYLRDWRRAAAVLFERESLFVHTPPSRKAGQKVAGTLSARTEGGGGLGTDFDLAGGVVPVAKTLLAKASCAHAADLETYVSHTLRGEGFDASEDGTGRGTPLIPVPQAVAFSCKDYGADAGDEIAPTLRAMGHSKSHANAGGQLAIAYDLRGREGGAQFEGPHDTANLRAASGGSSRSYVQTPFAVRRLTPVERERLMGFPDGFTQIPYGNKPASKCPVGPRYKALGNSWAVNVFDWVGQRIQMVEDCFA